MLGVFSSGDQSLNLILLVEDDERLAQLVKDYLEANGFSVWVESTGYNVTRKVEELNPQLVVLDIMLPGKDGLSICQEIRPAYKGPIMMLTAKESDMDQVLGLEFGADDYVIKPAEPRVLLARIRALLRRYQPVAENEDPLFEFGLLKVNTHTRNVSLGNSKIDLSSHEFDMLVELVRNAGKIVSREYLFQAIYRREYDGLDRTVDVRISHLRKKLGDNSQKPEKIKTVWGKGYLFVEDVWNDA